jgi:hypothetical protein
LSLWLQLSDGKFATYTGGNGSQALTFAYTSPPATPWPIFRWPGPTPMAVWRSMAVPSSGWRPGNALTGNVATDTHLVIDTMAPTETPPLTATTDNAQTDIGIGHTVTITLDTSEPVTVTGTPTLTLTCPQRRRWRRRMIPASRAPTTSPAIPRLLFRGSRQRYAALQGRQRQFLGDRAEFRG